MDDELAEWTDLYREQEVAVTQVGLELNRVRLRDRWRYAAEAVALAIVVLGGMFYIWLGGLSVLAGVLLLLFAATMVTYQGLRALRVEGASFATPAAYAEELAQRNLREIHRLEPWWPIVAAGVICVVVDAQMLVMAWDAYAAKPWLWPSAVAGEAGILAGVVWWRRRELARLEEERRAIAALRAGLEAEVDG
ncbi:MAG: hypothetical protein ACI8PZ_005557 [Myxococcota bacterium]|jgi:hypothetical protein